MKDLIPLFHERGWNVLVSFRSPDYNGPRRAVTVHKDFINPTKSNSHDLASHSSDQGETLAEILNGLMDDLTERAQFTPGYLEPIK